jgi:U11/U12 small nuclear ribonucleoprotein SNRNP48
MVYKKTEKQHILVLETTSGNLKSELELLAEKRDYKRRRQSYRAKNVHITKRTPIEVWK